MSTPTTGLLPKVAHLLRPAQGGMRQLVRTLLAAAQAQTPALLLAPEETLDNLADTAPDPGQRYVMRVESAAPYHQLAAGQSAGRYAKQNGAEVLHGHGLRYAPLFAAASVTSGLPLIVTLHNLVPADMNGLQKTAARTALSRASTVIAVSEAVAKSAIGVVTESDRITVIPNGINTVRFAVSRAERIARRRNQRERLGATENPPLVVCLSRLSPEKDVTSLLEGFALLTERMPKARLYIAGEGRLRKTLNWHIDLLGLRDSAFLVGVMPHDITIDLLFAADLFALTSREEGLSLAVLEAMAAGLPVVATNVGGLPEAVQQGETGLLVPPGDPRSVAIALEAILTNPETGTRMGDAGRSRATTRFTDTRMIEDTFALYRQVASSR